MKRCIFAVVIIAVIAGAVFSVKYFIKQREEKAIRELALPDIFSAQIQMQYDGTEYLCNVQKNGREITALIEKPERLKGVTVNITEESYNIGYMGIEISGDALPQKIGSVVGVIFNILEKLENMEYTDFQETEELVTLNYSLGNAMFSCSYNKATGIPKEIIVSELFKMEFLQFNFG